MPRFASSRTPKLADVLTLEQPEVARPRHARVAMRANAVRWAEQLLEGRDLGAQLAGAVLDQRVEPRPASNPPSSTRRVSVS